MDYLDKEEKEIIESYKRDEWISTDGNLKETIMIAAHNQQNIKNDRRA